MKKYLIIFVKNLFLQIISLAFIVGLIAAAINFPSSTPSGEIVGGKFMNYFNKILVDTGATTDGKVKNADKLDGYNHSNFIKTEVDPKIGTLTNGKWCKSNGTDVICNYDLPMTPSGSVIGGCGIATTDTRYGDECWGGATPVNIIFGNTGTCPTGSTRRSIGPHPTGAGYQMRSFLCIKN